MLHRTIGTLAVLAVFCAVPAFSQIRQSMPGSEERQTLDPQRGTTFRCQTGGDLLVHMVSQNEQLIAIVDAGDGPYRLNLHPWKPGDLPEIRWTDGLRTLTWSPGVQIMWMNGSEHRDCGRGDGHHH